MGVIAVASGLCFLNVVLWIVFAVKFRNLFSKDNILDEFKAEVNNILADLNNNVERDLNLIDDRIRQLKKVSAEADRRVKILRAELEKDEAAALLTSRLDEARAKSVPPDAAATPPSGAEDGGTTGQKPRKARSAQKGTRSKSSLSPAERYQAEQMQGNLFISTPQAEEETLPVPVTAGVGSEEQRALFGSGGMSIPVVRPPEYLADIPSPKPKDFNTLVREKHEEGKTVSQIAAELGSTVQEVRLSLKFGSL